MIPKIETEYENGCLGSIMAYKLTGEVGVVESVAESNTGWTTEISLKLKDGSVRKNSPSDFEDVVGEKRNEFLNTKTFPAARATGVN